MKTSHVILIIAGLLAVGVVLYLATRPSTGDDDSGGSGDGSSDELTVGTDGTTSRPATTRVIPAGMGGSGATTGTSGGGGIATVIGRAPAGTGSGHPDPNRPDFRRS